MRVPIAVQVRPYDIETAQPHIDAVREAFSRYLEEVPRKSTATKHGLMGPVGKILAEVKGGRRDPHSLKGYAIRVHEATGRNPSESTLKALEQGIDGLLGLLNDARVPVTVHDRLLDRLDYGLYFDLRKSGIESKERRRQEWISFLRDKYGDDSKLREAWSEAVPALEALYLPKKSEGRTGKKATAKQGDIFAFWESQGAKTASADDDEE